MAEALQLGVDVIATDFGGNTDFCTGPLAHRVRWRKAPIPRATYPFADGSSWAEPDNHHAAQLCQQVAQHRQEKLLTQTLLIRVEKPCLLKNIVSNFHFH